MNIHLLSWKITGTKPLIQSNPHGMWKPPDAAADEADTLAPTKRKKPLRGSDTQDFATCKSQLYVNDDGLFYHPAIGFMQCLQFACDGRNVGPTAAATVINCAVALTEQEFLLYLPDTLDDDKPQLVKGVEWKTSYRRAVNHNKKESQGGIGVPAIRPVWRTWGGYLTLEVDLEFFTKKGIDALTELLNVGGHYFGIGVGRKRIKTMRSNKPVWSDMGMGRFTAEITRASDQLVTNEMAKMRGAATGTAGKPRKRKAG